MNRPTNEDLNRVIEQIKNQMFETGQLLQDARAEVERLQDARAEVERLREALEVLVAEIEAEHDEYEERHGERPQMRALQQARAALAGKAEP